MPVPPQQPPTPGSSGPGEGEPQFPPPGQPQHEGQPDLTKREATPEGAPTEGREWGAPQGQPQYGAPQGQPQWGPPQGQPQFAQPGQQYGAPQQGQPMFTPPPPHGGPTFVAPQGPPPNGSVLELASWGRRWAAVTTDTVIRLVLAFLLSFGLFAIFSDDPFSDDTTYSDDLSNLEGLLLTWWLMYTLAMAFYSPLFMAAWGGQTPGKKMFGVRVVSELGHPIGFGTAMLREFVGKTIVISWIGSLAFGIAWLLNYLWPLWEDQSRAGHDFIARTRVVKA